METIFQKGEIGVWVFKLATTVIAVSFFWFFCWFFYSDMGNVVKAVGSTMGVLVITAIAIAYFIKNDRYALLLGFVTSGIGLVGFMLASILFTMIESTIIVQVATCCTVAIVAGSTFAAYTFKIKGPEYKVSVLSNVVSAVIQAILVWEGFYYITQWMDVGP